MINLLFSVLSSTIIALILKYNSSSKGEPIVLLMGNYFIASIIGVFLIFIEGEIILNLKLILFGILMGGIFVSSFFIFSKAIECSGTALATVSSRISVVIPISFSIIFFSEIPTIFQLSGILLLIPILIFFYFSIKSSTTELRKNSFGILLLLLVGIGIGDFGMKIFNHFFEAVAKPTFLFSIFFSALIVTLVFIVIKKIRIKRNDFLLGNALGIPNILSSFFLLAALEDLPSIIVYPLINIGVIVFTAILAFIIWKEKINKYGLTAIFLSVILIWLLRK